LPPLVGALVVRRKPDRVGNAPGAGFGLLGLDNPFENAPLDRARKGFEEFPGFAVLGQFFRQIIRDFEFLDLVELRPRAGRLGRFDDG
jgi:hypothetical protein